MPELPRGKRRRSPGLRILRPREAKRMTDEKPCACNCTSCPTPPPQPDPTPGRPRVSPGEATVSMTVRVGDVTHGKLKALALRKQLTHGSGEPNVAAAARVAIERGLSQ